MKSYDSGIKLTSKEAARMLGASEASVKRWADAGLLAAERTAGGHRRFRPADIALFKRESCGAAVTTRQRRAGVNSAPVPAARQICAASDEDLEGVEASVEALFGTLTRGSAEEASALLVKSYLDGRPLAFIFDQLLAMAMRRIGDLWHEGTLTVAQEHLATRAAISALQTLDKVVAETEANNLLAVCCSAENDYHELPVQCTELVLKHEGWEVLSLGPNTPFYALTEMVVRLHPRLVCVASTILSDLDRAVREFQELRVAAARVGAAIVLGGEGFADDNVRRRLPAELHADSFRELLNFADTLATRQMSRDFT